MGVTSQTEAKYPGTATIISQGVFSLYLRANNSILVLIHLTDLSTLSIKFAASLIELFHFVGVRTSRECLRGPPCNADRVIANPLYSYQ